MRQTCQARFGGAVIGQRFVGRPCEVGRFRRACHGGVLIFGGCGWKRGGFFGSDINPVSVLLFLHHLSGLFFGMFQCIGERIASNWTNLNLEWLLFSAMFNFQFKTIDEAVESLVRLETLHVKIGDQIDDTNSPGDKSDVV